MRRGKMETSKDAPSSAVELLFNGCQSLWRYRLSFDVVVAHHRQFQCLEIAISDPLGKYEVPKFYLNFNRLIQEIAPEEFKDRLQSKINECIRSHRDYTVGQLTREIQEEFVVQFVLSRIAVDDKSLNVFLQAKYGDAVIIASIDSDGQIDGVMPDGLRLVVLIPKPVGLKSIAVTHRKLFRSSLFLNCLTSFEEAKAAIDVNSQLATNFIRAANSCSGRQKMQVRERWIKAIRMVMRQNLTAKFRKLLAGATITTKSSNNTRFVKIKPSNLPPLNDNHNMDTKTSVFMTSPIHRTPVADMRSRLKNSFLHTTSAASPSAASGSDVASPHKGTDRWLPSVRQIVGDLASDPLDHVVASEAKSKPNMFSAGSPIRSKPKPSNQSPHHGGNSKQKSNKLLSAFPMIKVN